MSDFFVGVGMASFERVLGFFHVITGLWLMWLTFGTLLNIASGYNLPV